MRIPGHRFIPLAQMLLGPVLGGTVTATAGRLTVQAAALGGRKPEPLTSVPASSLAMSRSLQLLAAPEKWVLSIIGLPILSQRL